MATEKIQVQDHEISIISRDKDTFISLTDMVKKFGDDTMIYSWMRNRNTLEFIGIWEELHNPDFKSNEFVTFKTQAGKSDSQGAAKVQINHIYASEADILNMALFGMTAAEWHAKNPENKGNIRDYADVSQLVCLSNLENLNALFINENRPQEDRLLKLNKIAIQQMKLLTADRQVKKLAGKA
jgi:hypothetical protein